jgi:hypothetical protein
MSLYFWFCTIFTAFSLYFSVSLYCPSISIRLFQIIFIFWFHVYFIPNIPVPLSFSSILCVTFHLLLLLLLSLSSSSSSYNLFHFFLQRPDYTNGRQPATNILWITTSFKTHSASWHFAVGFTFIPGWVAWVKVPTDMTEKRNVVHCLRKLQGLWKFGPTVKESAWNWALVLVQISLRCED